MHSVKFHSSALNLKVISLFKLNVYCGLTVCDWVYRACSIGDVA